MQRRSAAELAERRGGDRRRGRASSPSCEIVNGGGTGSLELTARRGRGHRGHRRLGLLRPHPLRPLQPLHARPRPPASRCRSCASPRRGVATALGGGYLASGAGDAGAPARALAARRACSSTPRRAPARCRRRCSATPRPASRIGDRVYLRHAKAGELCERFDALHLVEGDEIVDDVPTYRGEGQAFL